MFYRATREIEHQIRESMPECTVLRFGNLYQLFGASIVVAVQTEKERLELRKSEAIKRMMKEKLIASGLSQKVTANITIEFKSEEKHGIFTWLKRW